MLSPFRAVLARTGARPLAVVCLLGWCSAIGTSLAVVLVVHHATGSFAVAGAASALQAIAAALAAPLWGRLVDRHGTRGLLSLTAGLWLAAALFVWAGLADSQPGLLVAATLLGAVTLPLIGVARGLWPTITGPDLTAPAHALNAAASDCAALGAPTLVAIISLAIAPIGAFIALIVGAGAATVLLTRLGLPCHEPTEGPDAGHLFGVLRGNGGLQAIVMGDLAMGTWSAGLTIVVLALAARHGHAALGGLLLAAGALGSIVMSLQAGSGALHAGTGTRYAAGAVLCSTGLLMLLLVSPLPLVAVSQVIIGAGLGLQNVAVFQALDVVSPPGRSAETFAWLTTASAAGAALGAAVSGTLVEHSTTLARLFILTSATAGAFVLATRRHAFDPVAPPRAS